VAFPSGNLPDGFGKGSTTTCSGANRRTAELLGGGSGLGALLGGIFGGGKGAGIGALAGAGIGALAGAGGGFATQAFTRGKEVRVPAESQLRFRLERNLVLHSRS
jgi:hypothetical protein